MSDDPTRCEFCWKNPCECPPRTEYRWSPGARGGPGDYKPVITPGVASIISKPLAYGQHAEQLDAAPRACLETLLGLTPSQRAQVLAELPETKPTAWQRLGEFLADKENPGRSYGYVDADPINMPARVYLFDEDDRAVAEGEGPTLDAALEKAMEKLK